MRILIGRGWSVRMTGKQPKNADCKTALSELQNSCGCGRKITAKSLKSMVGAAGLEPATR